MAEWSTDVNRMYGIVAVLLALFQATSQEVWVAVENRLQSVGGQEILVPGARYLSGLAIQEDAGSPIFWATDAGKNGAGLYKIQDNLSHLLYQAHDATYFESVAYSAHSQSVYLTSPSTNSIFRLNSNQTEAKRIFQHTTKKPAGLAFDPCSRTVFWTNTARGSPTIEAWREDEEDETRGTVLSSSELVSGNMTRPRGLALDTPQGFLYWTDQEKSEYLIWRVRVDGTDRALVCRGRGSEPFSLAVTSEHVYWSDWPSQAIYRIGKGGNCSAELVSRFKGSKPNGLAAQTTTTTTAPAGSPLNCDQRATAANHTQASPHPPVPASADVIIREEMGSLAEYNSSGGSGCGSPWEFYCLQGSCLQLEGMPLCICSPGWEGDRCEREMTGLLSLSPASLELVVMGLSILSLLLIISLILLAIFLHRYRKRPRIVRKRFISVARDSKKDMSGGVGPTKSCGLAMEEGIQLDIENCCNMTLCDTPCFEPPSRVPKDLAAKKSKTCSPSKRPKLDRKGLLESDDNDDDDLLF